MRRNGQETSLNAFLSENEQQLQSLKKINELLLEEQAFQTIIPKLKDLELRLQQPLRLLIIGEFNAGKSSLVNALLQEDVVATNNKATTAVNTMIEYGETPEVLLFFEDGSTKSYPFEQLEAVTAEIRGEGSSLRKRLLYVRLLYPAPFLQDVVLVDSPGLNSHHITHTEQTMSMIPKVDDAIWVFLGGGAGRGTEQEFLKDMVKHGIKPFGVINRIDEVDDYIFNSEQAFENDSAVLGDNVRGLLPISAYEARIAFRDSDDETLQLSGFLPFLDEMTKLKQNKSKQLERQKKYVSSVWLEIITIIQDIIQSPAYEKSKQTLKELTTNELAEVEKFKNEWESKKSDSVKFYQLLRQLKGEIPLQAWLEAQIIKDNQHLLPHYNRWDKVLNTLNELKRDIDSYKYHYQNFLNSYENQLGSIFTKYRHLLAKEQTVRDLENKRDQLYKEYVRLQTKIERMNVDIQRLQYELNPESVQEIYRKLVTYIVVNIEQYSSKSKAFQAKSKDIEKQLKGLVSQYLVLIPLRKHLDDFQKAYGLSMPANFNLQFFGQDLKNAIEVHTNNYQKMVASISVTDIKRSVPKTTIQFPEMLSRLPRFKKKWPVFLRPYTVGSTLLTATMGIIIGLSSIYWAPRENNDELNISSAMEEEYKLQYLSYEDQGEGIGFVTVTNEAVALYHAPDINSESEIFLRDGTAWEVYEIDGNWYRIQDDYWVHNDNVQFEKHITAYVSNYYEEGLATLEFDGDRLNMHKGASTDHEMLAYIEPGIYTITHVSEHQWFKIDDYGWVELGPNMRIIQHYLNEKRYTYDEPIRIANGTADDYIPVFTGPGRDNSVVGFIQGDSEVRLFEIPNGEWGRIGENIWVELDKYFDIDWTYTQSSYYETAIGQVYIDTPVLNVRDLDAMEGNLVGTVQAGTTLEVYEQSASTGWYRIGEDEWVSNLSDLVTFTTFEDEVEVNSYLPDTIVTYQYETPIYSQPFMQAYDFHSMVREQTYFDVLALYEGNDGDWYEVRDKYGDIYYIRKVDID